MVKLPVRFNPDRLLADDQAYFAEPAVAHFKRFAQGLADDEGQVDLRLRFVRDGDGHVVAQGQFEVACQLQCQRCMTPYNETFGGRFSLTFVSDEAAAEALPEALDPVILDEHGHIHVVDMIEDELILAMPVVPRHEDIAECLAAGYAPVNETDDLDAPEVSGASGRERENPFAALKHLTKND